MATITAPLEERRLLGITLVLIAYFFFTIIDSSAKWLTAGGMPTTQVVFTRYAVHLVLILMLFLPAEGRALVRTGALKLEILRGLFLLSSTVFNFMAVQFLPLTVTGAIGFTIPLIVCALSVPFLGEHVGWRRWTAILVGFAGILLVIHPGTDAFHPAALLSLLGATGNAAYFLATRRLANIDGVSTQQFYTALAAVLCTMPFAFGNWVWPHDPAGWLAFALIGLAGFSGHQLVTIAFRFAPASSLVPFGYFQIIYMVLSSWIIFGQPPTFWLFVGAPVVIASGIYIWLREQRLARTVAPVSPMD